MLKQTILAQAKENQIKRKSLMSIPEKNTLQDAELEAALLSLEKGQLTQNIMSEFINMRQESGGLDSGRKLSAPVAHQEEGPLAMPALRGLPHGPPVCPVSSVAT